MLVLSRKTQQTILIGNNVRITVVQVKGQSVRIGIEAPREIRVARAEVAEHPDFPANPAVCDGDTEITAPTRFHAAAGRLAAPRNLEREPVATAFTNPIAAEACTNEAPQILQGTVWHDRRQLRGDTFVERRVERRAGGGLTAFVAGRRR